MFEVVERVRRLLDAEDYARFEAAAERIDEIRAEFEECRRFASDVPDRLAKIDHDVGVLRSKYGSLVTGNVDSEDAARAAVSDLNRFFLASLYDVQIDVLQLYLAIQNDADVVEFRRSRLREKIGRYRDDFGRILEDDRVGAYHRELKGDGGGSGWLLIPDIPAWAMIPAGRKGRGSAEGALHSEGLQFGPRANGAVGRGDRGRPRTSRGGGRWCSYVCLVGSGRCGRSTQVRFGWSPWRRRSLRDVVVRLWVIWVVGYGWYGWDRDQQCQMPRSRNSSSAVSKR